MKPKYKIINKKNLYKGFFEMNELNFIHQKHDGTWSKKLKREIFSGAQVSTLLPYDPIKKEIVLMVIPKPITKFLDLFIFLILS